MTNNFEKQSIDYPDETIEIASEILKNFELEESPEELEKKFQLGKESNIVIIAEILRKYKEKNLSFPEFTASLQKQLNISQKKAEELATDLKNEVLSLARKSEEITAEETEKPEEPKSQDVYREPIE
ncbi:hypothetical protein COS93_01115 [bacterium (Candidatus Gribaldobacteria) CG07_land_8_20_14_0_80_33_18]|uniref:Uncharacterized protein n=1 Tax=bacterium (Candidatus Gribaldobacteria) CG07_land_8_20_14_0_80_33_18 TaxID=2014272 RepID=A0A2M6Z3N3_9BACT|nr:MAG: hypothetical protein COS93_01115 [bacterium (Candidatus Gribaldobacteria) CG07_land_8_20_14_0_80_33_18]PJB08352.1 MAG: hypothetical protein CO122_02045 [bacterium (Candidatus Gribaldobacteria) CG_4_9_14_3_um_filter_33_9]